MSKQYYGVVKLVPHNPAWYDYENEIYLTAEKRWFKCVTDDMNLKPIMKGIKAGLIMWDSVANIGTGPADEAKLPVVTFQCYCAIEEQGFGIIEEGVLAPYDPSYDVLPEKDEEGEGGGEEPDPEPPVDPDPEPPVDPDPEEPVDPEPEEPVEPEDPEPEEPVEKKLEIKIMQDDAEVQEVIIERGIKELAGIKLEIVAEGCEAGFENFMFDIINNTEVLEGFEGVDAVDQPIGNGGEIMIKDLAQPKDFNECEVARIRVHGQCNCEEPHMVEKELVIKVKKAMMFFDDCPIVDVYNPDELEVQGLDFVLNGMNMEIGPIDKMPIDEDDENPGAFLGWWILFAPEDANLKFEAWDAVGGDFDIEEPGCIVVHGVNYKVQWLDLTSGKKGIEVQVS